MLEKIIKFIKRHKLIDAAGKTIFVAVSGGVDSVVLLDVMSRLQSRFGFRIQVVHFNHRVRGKAADEDEAFVAALALENGFGFIPGRIEKKVKDASESFLRAQRLIFFNGIIENRRDTLIATGHNLNDNIETFLMRLARGSRLQGLTGIHPKRGNFIRPLLAVSRKEIETYASRRRLQFREDATNSDIGILRNKIRHGIIPFLQKELEPELLVNLSRVMDNLNHHLEIYEENLAGAVDFATQRTKFGISLHRKRYFKFGKAIRRGLIEYCISSLFPLNYSVSDRSLKIWDIFISGSLPGRKMTLPGNGRAYADRTFIVFGQEAHYRDEEYVLMPGKPLVVNNRYRITVKEADPSEVVFEDDRNLEYIDAGKCSDTLKVRFWRKGDMFKPLGMGQFRKLSDFFIDLKVGRMEKMEIPIICSDDRIIWVAGHRLDDDFKVTSATAKVFCLTLEAITEV
jgi:tRNA(Ile)-lysidine synthase